MIKGSLHRKLRHLVLQFVAPSTEMIVHVSTSEPCDWDRCSRGLLLLSPSDVDTDHTEGRETELTEASRGMC